MRSAREVRRRCTRGSIPRRADCGIRRRLPASWRRYAERNAAEKLLYRFVLIPVARKQLKKQAAAYAWSYQRPRWGPGRIDPFNPVKFGMLGLTDDGTIGNSDMLPLWNLAERQKRPWATFHWDGLTTSLRDSVLSSMLGDGMVAKEYRP